MGGFLVYVKGQELHRHSGSDIPVDAYRHRNVAGEIMAIRKAVAWCQRKDIKEISIHYDYQGLESWVTGDWKGKNLIHPRVCPICSEFRPHYSLGQSQSS